MLFWGGLNLGTHLTLLVCLGEQVRDCEGSLWENKKQSHYPLGVVREEREPLSAFLLKLQFLLHAVFSDLPGLRVGWGGVGWRTNGSGPAGRRGG